MTGHDDVIVGVVTRSITCHPRPSRCLGKSSGMTRSAYNLSLEKDYPESTVTTRDPPSRDRTVLLYEEPFYLGNRHRRDVATSTEDLAEELSEHQEEQEESAKPQNNQRDVATSTEDLAEELSKLQEDPWDTETPTVRERKKRDKTRSVCTQTEEEVPNSPPREQNGTGSSSQSPQGDAEAESESSEGFWGKFKRFWKNHSGTLSRCVTLIFTAVSLLVKFM